MHPYLKASIICFIIALIALSQISCSQTPLPLGDHKLYATITVQEEWCIMPDGTKVNGFTRYSTIIRSIAEICISRKSDDPERTMTHEFTHAWRNAIGLNATQNNQ